MDKQKLIGGIVLFCIPFLPGIAWIHSHSIDTPVKNTEMIEDIGYMLAKDIDADLHYNDSYERCRDLERDIDRLRSEQREVERTYGTDSDFFKRLEDELEDKQNNLDEERNVKKGYRSTRVGIIASLYKPEK